MDCFPSQWNDKTFNNDEQSELNEFEELVTKLQEIADDLDLCTSQGENRSINPKSQDDFLIGNNEQASFIHASKSKRKYSSWSGETSENVHNEILQNTSPVGDNHHANPLDASLLGSFPQIPPKEVPDNLNVSLKTSTENFGTCSRSESSFCEDENRKLSSAEFLCEQDNCETRCSTSSHAPTSDSCEMSIRERKLHYLNKDKETFIKSVDDVINQLPSNSQNISGVTNFKQSVAMSVSKDSNADVGEVSRGLTVGEISSELILREHNTSGAISTNVKEAKPANAAAEPCEIRLQPLKPAVKKRFSCNICHKVFPCKPKLDIHYRSHTGEKPFVCQVCNRGFTQKHHLTRHLLIHKGEKPFVCEECNRGFTQKYDLKRHVLTHKGEKPFPCDKCNKRFIKKSDLESHFLTHKGEKPHKYPACEKAFALSSNCKMHYKLKHQ